MAQEEHTHTPRYSNSSGGGSGGAGGGTGGGGGGHRSSKKLKHKKVPQRGMGVAQLEKIISEEQQKREIISPVSNFRPPPSIPMPPPLPPNHRPLISKTDATSSGLGSKPTNTTTNGGGGGGGGSWSRLWGGGEYNQSPENSNHGVDHHGFTAAMATNRGRLPYESNPSIWPSLPHVTQKSQLFQQPCSSSMMNVSLGTSSSSMNYQTEPPSNQNYCGNNYPPLWPEEEKMVGMKRSYPFLMENMPIPSFSCKFLSASRSNESTSCSNGGTTSLESSNPIFRDTPSSLGTIMDQTGKKFIDDSRGLTRDFLTLAPPRPSSSSRSDSSSKEKLPHFEALAPYHGQTREWSKQQALHSFFPAAKTSGNSNGDAGENVDLNLKL